MPLTRDDILLGALVPAGVAAAIVLVGWLVGGRWLRASVALGAGLGFMTGHALLWHVPSLRPVESIDWLFYASAAAGLLGAIEALLSAGQRSITRAGAHAAIVLCLAVLMAWLVSRPLLVFSWTGWIRPLGIGIIAVILLLIWLSLAKAASRSREAISIHIALFAMSALASVTCAMSGSVKIGQIGGLLTAALAGVAAMSWTGAPAATGVFAFVYVGVIASASEQLYAGLSHFHAALLLAGPLGMWLGELLPGHRPFLRGVATVVGAVILPALAAILAGIAFARADAGYSEWNN
jgi:hypothetical protein